MAGWYSDDTLILLYELKNGVQASYGRGFGNEVPNVENWKLVVALKGELQLRPMNDGQLLASF